MNRQRGSGYLLIRPKRSSLYLISVFLLLFVPLAHADVAPLSAVAPRILLNDTETLSRLQAALSSNAPAALRFKAMVDSERANPGTHYAFQAWYAALMYRLTGTTSYGTFAVDKIDDFVASEEAKIAAGQRAVIAGDSYLEVGDLLGDLALVYDWANDLVTPSQKTRWTNYMNTTLFNVWNPDLASWGGVAYPWSGWSVNDPFNNYYYSFLEATLFAGLATYADNPQAPQWIDKFYTEKISNQLLPAFNGLTGGGSREGTGYGTALRRLFKLYFWWEKSTGVSIANQTPHTLATLYWYLHTVVPSLDKIVPTGDHSRDETAALYDYHRDLLQELISLYPNEPVAGVAKQLLSQSSVPQMSGGFNLWSDFINDWPSVAPRPLSELHTAYYGSGTGNFFSRSSWNADAVMTHLMAGPYDQSHAHKDQGSFLLNSAGVWIFDDANRRSHSGIEQDEEMHNLVRFESGGSTVRQAEGAPPSQVLALHDHPLFSYASVNTQPIYNGNPEVVKSEREFLFIKPGVLVLFDRAGANASSVGRIFQLQTSGMPTLAGNRLTFSTSGQTADVWRTAPVGLPWSTVPVFGGQRAEAVDHSTAESLFLHVIGMNNKVTTVVSDNTATETGAHITFDDGATANVRFSNTGHGGTLSIVEGSGQTLHDAVLPNGVSPPPSLPSVTSTPTPTPTPTPIPPAPPPLDLCDGVDNDGNGLVDEGFRDFDGDGRADCVDLDDDGDGIPDTEDECPFLPTTHTITGTAGNNRLTGTPANDLIRGLSGNDRIRGGGGRDCIVGGEGNDILRGQAGRDILLGGAGQDLLYGGRSSDLLEGGDGDDRLHGWVGNDTLKGDEGNDRLYGGKGRDIVEGGSGDDVLRGESGADTLDGGPDTDRCRGGRGIDAVLNCESASNLP
jgi:hypothetical protein